MYDSKEEIDFYLGPLISFKETPMAKEYIRFTLHANFLNDDRNIYIKVFRDVFNHILPDKIYNEDLTILCSFSQFARFIIRRDSLGGRNIIREMNAKIFYKTEDSKVLDFTNH